MADSKNNIYGNVIYDKVIFHFSEKEEFFLNSIDTIGHPLG